MQNLMERRIQRWRAIAEMDNGNQALLCLGMSDLDVKNHYANSWYNLLSLSERKQTSSIMLQKWNGSSMRGKWINKEEMFFLPINLDDYKTQ